jgi:hypothetical protein
MLTLSEVRLGLEIPGEGLEGREGMAEEGLPAGSA